MARLASRPGESEAASPRPRGEWSDAAADAQRGVAARGDDGRWRSYRWRSYRWTMHGMDPRESRGGCRGGGPVAGWRREDVPVREEPGTAGAVHRRSMLTGDMRRQW